MANGFAGPPFQTSPKPGHEEEQPVIIRNLLVENLGTNITVDMLRDFLKLDRDDYTKSNSSLEMSSDDNGNNTARINIPEDIYEEVFKLTGSELSGRKIVIREVDNATNLSGPNGGVVDTSTASYASATSSRLGGEQRELLKKW